MAVYLDGPCLFLEERLRGGFGGSVLIGGALGALGDWCGDVQFQG